MPRKISQLEAATDVTASDLIQIVDIEDTGMAVSGTNKRATAQLMANELGKLTNITATGSTAARSLANRFADVVNVKDFGAVGDGVADDTAAIQAAIDYSSSIGGCIVFLPEGSYKTSSALSLKPNVYLKGSGTRATFIIGSGTHSVIAAVGSLTNILSNGKISDLTIRGGSKTNTSVRGVDFRWVNRYEVTNLEIFQCYIGFYFDNSWQTKLDTVHIHGGGTDQSYIGFYGAEVHPSNQNNTVNAINCVVQGVEKYGFRLINFNGSKFVNCEAMNGEIGWYLGAPITGTERIRWGHFSNCLGDTNSQSNWRLEKGAALAFEQCSFSNCWAGNSLTGFEVFNASQINISSPMIIGNNGVMLNAIEATGSSRISISGGTFIDYSGAGIKLNNCLYFNINGNHCYSLVTPATHKGFIETGTSNYNIGLGNTFNNGITILGANTQIIRNNGDSTASERTGSVVLPASSTSVTVNHLLSFTPSINDVRITARHNITPATRLWVTDMTSTQFTINSDVGPTGDCTISWSIDPIRS
jgi:hypothetical protein